MRALQFKAVGVAAMVDLPEPEPRPGEVLLEVAATGLCHTDTDILQGRYMGSYPIVPGHEVAGRIVAVGAEVECWKEGDRVAVDPLLPCGRCSACRAARPGLCDALGAYGSTRDGGFAPLMAVRSDKVHGIGSLSYPVAALAEPLACVLHGIDRAKVGAGAKALVFGAGPIGLMMMMGLQVRHGAQVTMVDLEESRLSRARELGADGTLDAHALAADDARHDWDLVVDCTGVTRVCQSMPNYARSGGTMLVFGVCPPDATMAVHPYEVFRRELVLVGSHSLSDNLPEAIAALQALGSRAEALISHRLTLEGIADHLRAPSKAGTMKVQFAPAA